MREDGAGAEAPFVGGLAAVRGIAIPSHTM